MPQIDIVNAAKISWNFTSERWPEQMTFGVHTGMRTTSLERDNVMIAAEQVWVDLDTGLGGCILNQIVYSEWDTAPSFVGWHQRVTRELALQTGGELDLPHQIAVVVGLRNTSEIDVALGRRRNRSYIGPISSNVLGSDGRVTPTFSEFYSSRFADFDGVLRGIPDSLPGEEFTGLCVASQAEGVLMEANQVVQGQAFDTMRSRRQKVLESKEIQLLPV